MKNNIKDNAKELLFYYGLKSVSMDDIAKKAGVSKRTIYEFFEDKNELVAEIVHDLMDSYTDLFKAAQSDSEDAIDEVIQQEHELLEIFKIIRPAFLYDLDRTFPELSEQLEQIKLRILKGIITNLRRGKKEGIYRQDIDIALVADLRFHQLMNVVKPALLTSHEIHVVQLSREFTVLYLHAIATEKGRNSLDRYLKDKDHMTLAW